MQFRQKIEMFRGDFNVVLPSALVLSVKNLYKRSPTYAKGISVARRSVLISQFADDTTENENKHQIPSAISVAYNRLCL